MAWAALSAPTCGADAGPERSVGWGAAPTPTDPSATITRGTAVSRHYVRSEPTPIAKKHSSVKLTIRGAKHRPRSRILQASLEEAAGVPAVRLGGWLQALSVLSTPKPAGDRAAVGVGKTCIHVGKSKTCPRARTAPGMVCEPCLRFRPGGASSARLVFPASPRRAQGSGTEPYCVTVYTPVSAIMV